MSFESLTSSHMAAAVGTGAAGYALYRYGGHLRQLVTSTSAGAAAAGSALASDDELGSGSLVLTILKHHPKNMNHQQIRNVIQFVKDTIAGRPMNDRALAVCPEPCPLWLVLPANVRISDGNYNFYGWGYATEIKAPSKAHELSCYGALG